MTVIGIATPLIVALLGVVLVLPAQFVPHLTDAELDAAGIENETERFEWQEARDQRRQDIRGALLSATVQSLAGLVLIAGSVATWRTFQLNRKKEEVERFRAAAELIGHESASVRTAGLFALGRLVHDGEAEPATTIDLVCAFVREHAAKHREAGVTDNSASEPTEFLSVRAPDVQAAVTVLGRINGPGNRITLPGVDLARSDLWGADLSGANLSGSDLSGARLRKANLRGTNLWDVNLTDANLADADLSDATLHYADLTRAILIDVDLSSTKLHGAQAWDQPTWPSGFSPAGTGFVPRW